MPESLQICLMKACLPVELANETILDGVTLETSGKAVDTAEKQIQRSRAGMFKQQAEIILS